MPRPQWEWLISLTGTLVTGYTPLTPYDWLAASASWRPIPQSPNNYAQLGMVVVNTGSSPVLAIVEGSEDGLTPAMDGPGPIIVPAGKSVTVLTDDPKPMQFWRLSVDLPTTGTSGVKWGVKAQRWFGHTG